MTEQDTNQHSGLPADRAQGGVTGRVIAGRYELSALIGQGGMGQVWAGYDRRLDRRVAVKLLNVMSGTGASVPGSREAAQVRTRFERECRVTAQVEHPGLVTVHDAGSDGDDLYLVMRHVDGVDLADHLEAHRAKHGAYPVSWAVAVAAQLCAVLGAVHAVPIVHRDLKPTNVMVRQDGSLVVLDLGIASVMDTDATRLTHTGLAVGSPSYMAPEQAMAGAVDPRTDLYALGTVLYELLTGTVPFPGTQVLSVLYRHLHEAPVPVRQLRPDVPAALDALVTRLLAKDQQQRPADAQAVYEELAPLLPVRGRTGLPGFGGTGTSAEGGPPGPLDPSRPFLRPHAPWPDRATAPSPDAPVSTSTVEVGGGSRTDVAAAVDSVKRLLDEGRITQAVDTLGAALPAAAAEHGEHSPVVRTLRKLYATTLMDDGQYRRALPEWQTLADEWAARGGQADPQALRFRYEAARCLEQLGATTTALAEYRLLLPYYRQQAPYGRPAPDPQTAAVALDIQRRIAHLLLSLGDREGARTVLAALLYDAEQQYPSGHPFTAEVQRLLQWIGQVA